MKEFVLNDLFCGAGGFGLGFKKAGFKFGTSCDIDKFAIQTYRHNLDENAELKSISDYNGTELNHADIWAFGVPLSGYQYIWKSKGHG